MQMKTGTDTVSCQKQQPESDAGGSSAQLPAESIYIFQCGVHNVKLSVVSIPWTALPSSDNERSKNSEYCLCKVVVSLSCAFSSMESN